MPDSYIHVWPRHWKQKRFSLHTKYKKFDKANVKNIGVNGVKEIFRLSATNAITADRTKISVSLDSRFSRLNTEMQVTSYTRQGIKILRRQRRPSWKNPGRHRLTHFPSCSRRPNLQDVQCPYPGASQLEQSLWHVTNWHSGQHSPGNEESRNGFDRVKKYKGVYIFKFLLLNFQQMLLLGSDWLRLLSNDHTAQCTWDIDGDSTWGATGALSGETLHFSSQAFASRATLFLPYVTVTVFVSIVTTHFDRRNAFGTARGMNQFLILKSNINFSWNSENLMKIRIPVQYE